MRPLCDCSVSVGLAESRRTGKRHHRERKIGHDGDACHGHEPCFTFLAQVMHKGKTSAVLPPRPWREGVLHSISANSWQHTEGIIDFIAFIDERFNPDGVVGVPWLLVWDLASIHTSEATRTTLKEKFPCVSMCYIPVSSTGYNRPLNVAVFSFLAGDISNGEGNPGQACGFEQCCTEHRVEAIFPGRVGLQCYATLPVLSPK